MPATSSSKVFFFGLGFSSGTGDEVENERVEKVIVPAVEAVLDVVIVNVLFLVLVAHRISTVLLQVPQMSHDYPFQ